MADMLKFYKGLVANLPESGVSGGLYITTDEGAIYLGTGTGMKRLGDFIQVANVAALPTAGAHQNCMYYCVAENILAKWNGTTWTQINKQPTAEEMKTLLGLGSMAYVSEVAEDNLSTALKEKVNAASEGNHSHLNKALLDTYTQTEADLADAVAKKHSHANATELAKIADGDKAKWDAVVDDHLTSADKTALETSIKEAKKAGTDANTALETYKVSNDARVKAVEDDIADINNETSGILAQAKTYADGKDAAIAAAKKAGTDAQSAIDEYKTSNDSALAAVKATADAAAVKTEVNTALAGKVDKVEGKSLISDTEIARLADLKNYDDTQVKADIKTNTDAIGVLNGANTVDGSVAKAVKTAQITLQGNIDTVSGKVTTLIGSVEGDDAKSARTIASEEVAKIVAGADTAYDTLKEISDWISGHKSDASAMNSAIVALEAIVDGIGGDGEKATVKDYVDDAITALKIGEYAKAADLTALAARVTTIEGQITTINGDATTAGSIKKALADAKTYTESCLEWQDF